MKKIYLTLLLILFSTNAFAAQTQIAQVNGMMCIRDRDNFYWIFNMVEWLEKSWIRQGI